MNIKDVKNNLNNVKVSAFETLGLVNNGIEVVPPIGLSSNNNTIVYPFSRKKNIKFESLIEENLIISPYYNANIIVEYDNDGNKKTNNNQVLPHPNITCDWPTALVSNYEYKSVMVDSLESYGSVWRIVKSKRHNSSSSSNTNVSSSNKLNSYDAVNNYKYCFQCCVSVFFIIL